MQSQSGLRLVESLVIAAIGGYVFSLVNVPLPWVLGALTFVMVWQGITDRKAFVPIAVSNGGFIVLGIYFGLYFTTETFQTVAPYILPYIFITFILIAACIFFGLIVTKWIDVDQVTSVFSLIPGGLSEMAIASESLGAKVSLVVIFQTIRLIAVLFTIPPVMTFIFSGDAQAGVGQVVNEVSSGGMWSYLWFILPVAVAVLIRHKIPAGIIIGALGVTALLNVSPAELAQIPSPLMNAAQVAVGAGLGKNILFKDLKIGGKYCLIYFVIAMLVISVSFGLGYMLAQFTVLNNATAILAIAPGGFFEMVLTAYNIGGDPAIVSALQLVRILLIVMVVPSFLKWWFTRGSRRSVTAVRGEG
ncbi:AbrB family transcriptional regulator [Oceanobacillus halotolerans]|uniref:AbrB family transcriptional regulator n=1 Tax=Oceanobacillus halotolerans TaxID=2663380 RepID=UPI0013D95CF4|nr:AbrB family transcriptional regulator [Oceanobacillus halotolerans]